ncbi:hypothetical protein CMV_012228 [Castanea mollissima]|uniref:Uncharacterized protein n=1 Tax=Castanea mollissima TaxID=60419 RepID=A0A8J4VZF2_9ROSI|nr:hypothetical protein CMV_012228 [Castanea mollissima]
MYKNKHIYSFQQKLSSQITKFGGLGTWLRRRLSMLLKLLITLMVMICKEAMAGNHSLRSCKFCIGYVIYRRLTSYFRYSKPLKTWKWRSTSTHFASLASAIPIRSFWKQTP